MVAGHVHRPIITQWAGTTLIVCPSTAPQVALLGSGNRLSLLVTDGPARLLLATGDNPIEYENALTHVRPIFARRVDVLLVAGSGSELRVPLAAYGDAHVRSATALAALPRPIPWVGFPRFRRRNGFVSDHRSR